MNENLNLIEILKDCPKGTKLYSILFGDVELERVCKNEKNMYPIEVKRSDGMSATFMKNGRFYFGYDGECTLFPSREQRDWSKFTAPWLEKERFDLKSLQPYDKVIARIDEKGFWCCELFSFIEENTNLIKGCGAYYKHCIPYNDDTKHMVGTNEDAPEYYKYWED